MKSNGAWVKQTVAVEPSAPLSPLLSLSQINREVGRQSLPPPQKWTFVATDHAELYPRATAHQSAPSGRQEKGARAKSHHLELLDCDIAQQFLV